MGGRRFSPVRLLAVVGALGAVGVGTVRLSADAVDRLVEADGGSYFAPYVDVTLTPTFHFEDPLSSPSDDVVLGFVVAEAPTSCTPTWGTYYGLDAAGAALDLDRRIARLRERGGDIVVSFGGALNAELAVACTDPAQLTQAYLDVIDRYGASVIDFDLEGDGLADASANSRRAAVVAELQQLRQGLTVWVTLPVAPTGLTGVGVEAVDSFLEAEVELAGVNIMAMDYGASREDRSMREATEEAIASTTRQLDAAYRRVGRTLEPDSIAAQIGVTPMIGQNDVAGEIFELDDAEWLLHHVEDAGLGRVSMWSANRDQPCGAQVDLGQVSNVCSGVDQEPFEFAFQFGALPGRATAEPPDPVERTGEAPRDDPDTSPYPIWRTSKVYEQGDKVVWHQNVYEAKWWTQGNLPDEPVEELWDTPWRYLGPVLASDAIAPEASTDPADRPEWDVDGVYLNGDEVVLDGWAYRAKWWTQADQPDPDPDRPSDVPWEVIGRAARSDDAPDEPSAD